MIDSKEAQERKDRMDKEWAALIADHDPTWEDAVEFLLEYYKDAWQALADYDAGKVEVAPD